MPEPLMTTAPQPIASLSQIAGAYDVVLCDVWGVVHNGVRYSVEATTALRQARAAGKTVILITNAPRPATGVQAQLDAMKVPRDAYDGIVTSGDVTRRLVAENARLVLHLGPERDLTLFDGLDVELVEEQQARSVVCTGLNDDRTETPEDYHELLARLRSRDLPFICANPDIVVEHGEQLIWCAGALARDYGQLGGRTLIAGKPFEPIYAAAMDMAGTIIGKPVPRDKALAIGDGVLTDIKGAQNAGVDVLFVSGGIHTAEYGERDAPDLAAMADFLARHGQSPKFTIPGLR
jgi:HAD superfamily hydrolase (TIGR01459 family)